MVELPLSKEELLLVEKQEKQLRIIAEELRTIQATHEKSVLSYKKRLRLQRDAEKVVAAVRERKTNTLIGSDMARLVKAIEHGDIFQNHKRVEEVTHKRNDLINELIRKIKKLINEHKEAEIALPAP